jgi:hypothetical protein
VTDALFIHLYDGPHGPWWREEFTVMALASPLSVLPIIVYGVGAVLVFVNGKLSAECCSRG